MAGDSEMELSRIRTILYAVTVVGVAASVLAGQAPRRPAPNNMFPQWSHDGRRITFTSDRGGNSDIYVMDADGGNVRRLTDTRATERAAVWSPEGKRIVFSSDGDGPSEIYVMRADGSNPLRLTGPPK